MASKAMARLLKRLNDPSHQYPAQTAAAMNVEFRAIEREWKAALEPGSLRSFLKRLGVEIERQECVFTDKAVAALNEGRDSAYLIGKSARLMSIRAIIERENP